jgi:hypothetical protein
MLGEPPHGSRVVSIFRKLPSETLVGILARNQALHIFDVALNQFDKSHKSRRGRLTFAALPSVHLLGLYPGNARNIALRELLLLAQHSQI